MAPVAEVNKRLAEIAPVAKTMVELDPVVASVNWKVEVTAFQETVKPGSVNAASIIDAAFVKLVAAERSMLAEVRGAPSKLIVKVPGAIASSCVSVMFANDPETRKAARAAALYGANSIADGLIVELV